MEENKKIIGYVISNKGKVRENNEDNYLLGNCINAESQDENEAHLYQSAGHWICVGVFDGMGGEADGEVASSVAAQTFQENTMNLQILDKDKITVLIEKTFLKANKAVIEKRKNGISGTTGTVIATDGNQFGFFIVEIAESTLSEIRICMLYQKIILLHNLKWILVFTGQVRKC